MNPPTEERRPDQDAALDMTQAAADLKPATTLRHRTDIAVQLHRRRAASYRCMPLACGHRDPLAALVAPPGPSTFGLEPGELRRHANDLWASGWSVPEVCQVLDILPAAS